MSDVSSLSIVKFLYKFAIRLRNVFICLKLKLFTSIVAHFLCRPKTRNYLRFFKRKCGMSKKLKCANPAKILVRSMKYFLQKKDCFSKAC